MSHVTRKVPVAEAAVTRKGRIGEAAAWIIAVIAWAISLASQVGLAVAHGFHGFQEIEALGDGLLPDLASLSMMMLALDQAERGKSAKLTWGLSVLAGVFMEWANVAYAWGDPEAVILHAWPPFLVVATVFVLVHIRRSNAADVVIDPPIDGPIGLHEQVARLEAEIEALRSISSGRQPVPAIDAAPADRRSMAPRDGDRSDDRPAGSIAIEDVTPASDRSSARSIDRVISDRPTTTIDPPASGDRSRTTDRLARRSPKRSVSASKQRSKPALAVVVAAIDQIARERSIDPVDVDPTAVAERLDLPASKDGSWPSPITVRAWVRDAKATFDRSGVRGDRSSPLSVLGGEENA